MSNNKPSQPWDWSPGLFSRGQKTSSMLQGRLVKIPARTYAMTAAGGGDSVMNAFWLLFGLNAIPFGLWQYARYTQDAGLVSKLRDNTMTSLLNTNAHRWWTTVTAAFSHIELFHFGFNMFALHTFCRLLSMVPSFHGGHILWLYLGSAMSASAGFIFSQKTRMQGSQGVERERAFRSSALGASGAVLGLAGMATCFFPTAPMQLMFIPINIPLWAITIGYAAFDAYQLKSTTSFIGHAGHLGGLAFGLLAYFVRFRRFAPFGIAPLRRR